MSDNIKVAIKVRPLIKRENDERLAIQWVVEKNAILQIDPETKKRADTVFHFDYIFDMGQTNQDVFDATVKPIVQAAMNGFNGTIFAYGQTGSGKTYTMMGTKEERGVIPLAVDYIFNYIRNDCNREFLLRVSYIEIYNEKINDLLDKNKTDMKIKEDNHGHIIIDCKEEVTNSPECVLHAMKKGDKNRRTGETNMNDRSSRSHTIFRVTIESCVKDEPDGTAKEAQLNLIDLAGSERVHQTGATGERFNEGRHINLSLSTLSLVIKQLSESQTSAKYVNFRDSKLTRILQPSLGGNAMTAIICAVTPAADDETQCTLAFAARAKGIKNKPQINENVSDKALLKRIRTQKSKLEAEMQDMKTELAEKDKQLLRGRIALMNMQILTSNSQNEEEFRIKARRRRTWAGSSTGGPNLFGPSFVLPTIDECERKSDIEMEELIQQQTIYGMDVHNQSFQTAFADFELQLIEDQREKNRLSNDSDCGFVASTVTTRPRIIIEEVDAENINVCSPERTPERKRCPNICDPSPGTPKHKLREKLDTLLCDYDVLREFTTLERQLLQTDCIAAANQAQYEKNLTHIAKSLADSEVICRDLNKKYAELQSDHAILMEKYEQSERECEMLRSQVQSLSPLRTTLSLLESERNDYKSQMDMALMKQKSLEEEAASRAFEMDLLKSKHKSREKELEASLSLAWKEFTDPNEKQKLTDIIHLQSVIDELTAKISALEAQSNSDTKFTSFTENDFILKIDQLDHSLKQSEEQNSILMEKISQTAESMHQCDETPSTNEFKIQIAEYIKEIEELKQKIAQKDLELANNNNQELTIKFSEANDKLEIYEKRIDEMKSDIEKLQLNLNEKCNELCEIKLRLNVTIEESEKISNETQMQLTTYKEQLEAAITAINMKEREIMEMKQSFIANENENEKCEIVESKLESLEIENKQNDNDTLTVQLQERNSEMARLEKIISDMTTDFTSANKSHQDKINELLATNEKLRDQIAIIQSERTMYEGDRADMQTLLQEKDDQLKILSKLQNELEFAVTEKMEFERIITEQRTQLNEKVLAMENMHSYESKINNLNSYNASLQSFVKKLQNENEEVKKEVESGRNSLKMLENERESLMDQLQLLKMSSLDVTNHNDISRCENIVQNTTLSEIKSALRVCQVVKPLNIAETPASIKKTRSADNKLDVTRDDKETSSIFANGSYFDNMDVSVTPSELIDSTCMQNLSTINNTINNTTVMESKLELEDSKILLNLTYDELDNCLLEKNPQELRNIVKELLNLKTTLEEENAKLVGIKNDFSAFKLDFEKLQQTILLLTNENADMAGKLMEEKEHADKIEIDLRKHIDELKTQLETVIGEKQAFEINIKVLEDKIDNVKDTATTIDEEKVDKLLGEYDEKIETLTDENIKLSNTLIEKIEELENLKKENSQQCDINCSYRERWEHLIERTTFLENENTDLSTHLMAKIEELDIINDKYEILDKHTNTQSNSHEELSVKIDALMHLIEKLKTLNAMLPDLKPMSCHCTPHNELNETRHAIKDNMELLNRRLHEFQENFERIRAQAEKLTHEANQHINSSIHETSMNSSVLDNTADISLIEDKVQRLQSEYEILHDCLQRWSMFNETDAEKLRDNNTTPIHNTSRHSPIDSPRASKRDAKIDRCQGELAKYKMEQQQLTRTIDAFEKFQNNMTHMQHEIKSLRATRVMYKQKIGSAEERVKNLEERTTALNNQLDKAHGDNKKLDEIKSILEKEIENFKCDAKDKEEMSNELRQSLIEAKDSNTSLQSKLEELRVRSEEQLSLDDKLEEYKLNIKTLEAKIQDLTNSLHNSDETNKNLKSELNVIKSTSPLEREEITILTSTVTKYKENIEILETLVKELREKLSYYALENANLSEQITKLESLGNKPNLNISDNNMEICEESFTQCSTKDKSIEELAKTRACITKEIATLQHTELQNFNEKSVSELFGVFITTLMAKEQEIMKTLHRRHEREKHELVEQNKQCIDAEKRSATWAKALEADIERLQSDITKQEQRNATLVAQISKLECTLMDSEHEKELLKEKMTIMETDFNALQADYEKYSKSNVKSDDVTNVSNEREKSLQDAMVTREIEYKTKINRVENEYKKKIEELTNLLETYKTKNMDLNRELEALEANERQLKSIIDLKVSEFTKANVTIQSLQNELKDLTDIYNQANDDNEIKNRKIEEITSLLKTKCDKMSEYKTNLETIKPEYEMLKVQASERQLRLEIFKSEIEKLRDENRQEISSMKDQLDSEEIKSAGLNKQLADITNRNINIQTELEQLKEKCQELKCENERLMKKMRNSTSKLTVEREMEDLRDENRMQLKNLEGATNRIVELQTHKSQLMKDHVELQGRYDSICRENNELKSILDRNKNAGNNSFEMRDKYDALLQEKNKIALELEEKRSIVSQLEIKIERLVTETSELKDKNVELDAEMDDIVKKIHEMDEENTELQRKIFELENSNGNNDSNKKLSMLNSSNLDTSKSRYEEVKKENEVLTMTVEMLKTENTELKNKIGNRTESKSCGGSRSSSSTTMNRSRQRRSDLFNQNRPLQGPEDVAEVPIIDCQCEQLRKKIIQLEQELVSKKARTATLELQIESQIFPYQTRCLDLENVMLAYKQQNAKLSAENNELRIKKTDCVRCINWRLLQRDQATQISPKKPNIFLNGGNSKSGIVGEHEMEQAKINKLENDKHVLKTQLKRRIHERAEMKEKIKELQSQLETLRSGVNIPDKNFKHVMKENVPTNITGQTKLFPSQRHWFN